MRWNRLSLLGLGALLMFSTPALGAKPANWWDGGTYPPSTGDGGPVVTPDGVCGTPVVCDIWAGKTRDVGSVTVSNDQDNLYVAYKLTYAGATFKVGSSLSLGVETSLADFPKDGTSRPPPGQLEYQYLVTTSGLTEYTFTIPLAELGFPVVCDTTSLYVVAHSDVQYADGSSDTGFGGCIPGNGSSWWYYMTYTVQCCDDEPPSGGEETCETAFARLPADSELDANYVFGKDVENPEGFPSLGLKKANRWGWAMKLPTSDGAYELQLWAGAAQNNIVTKGELVGSVSVTVDENLNNSSSVTLSVDLSGGWEACLDLETVHVYLSDAAPTTASPGQYGNTYEDQGDSTGELSFSVTDTNGDDYFWLIVHADVCGTWDCN